MAPYYCAWNFQLTESAPAKSKGLYGAGAVAISTVRLSWPHAA